MKRVFLIISCAILIIGGAIIATRLSHNEVVDLHLNSEESATSQAIIQDKDLTITSCTAQSQSSLDLSFNSKHFTTDRTDSLCTKAGKLLVSEGRLLRDVTLSVRSLSDSELPEMDYGMTNVTPDGEALRLLPHGTHFTREGASVYLAYDRTKIPSGYTEEDIRTFYYDTEAGHWVALERIAIDAQRECVISRTSHFTDMINGVIQAPESPETEGYAPTMMTEVKAADPSLKMNLIAPPTANSRGTASIQYSLEMPPARNGMSPQISIQYSSEGGSGILGEGWNMSFPSITVDTRWGVPRYSEENETETYSMSGSMLVTPDESGNMTVAHRDKAPQKRKADRRFYTRQGGDFSRIIRKGSSPSDYYWEVTDKQGTKYIYGDAGTAGSASLKGSLSGNRDVISEWHLKRIEELHGDYVEYFYETADEEGMGGIKTKAHYVKEIHAGNAGQPAHTVVRFEYRETPKSVRQSNARYGFLTSSDKLLDRVDIEFQGKTLRSYTFEYRTGAFGREVLASVSHLDSYGEKVSSHDFDYYNDVESGGGYRPFASADESWNTNDDGLDADFTNKLGYVTEHFSDRPTAMGGTKSQSLGGSFYAGVGVVNGSGSTSGTVGGSISYSHDKSYGLSTFMDINGDGLPDKIYRKGGILCFRPQKVSSDGKVDYGDELTVKGINKLTTTVSNSFTGGVDAKVGVFSAMATVGADKSKTTTKTTDYFMDVNGDGLVDYVSNGKVYFNHIETDAQGRAIPHFTSNSSDTDSPIVYDVSKIDKKVGEPTQEEKDEVLQNSPMEDMVRVWEAPMDGKVSVTGTISLIAPDGDYDKDEYAHADGVRVAVQKGNTEYWSQSIGKDDTKEYSVDKNIDVKRGERIYFRLQSGSDKYSNGAFDMVRWSPVVTYKDMEAEELPEGYLTTTYRTSEGAVPDAISATVIDSQRFTLSGQFTKPVTTDDVELRIVGSNEVESEDGKSVVDKDMHEVVVYSKRYAWNETADAEDVSVELDCTSIMGKDGIAYSDITNFRCEVYSESNVAWDRILWQPTLTYTDSIGKEVPENMTVSYLGYNNVLTY